MAGLRLAEVIFEVDGRENAVPIVHSGLREQGYQYVRAHTEAEFIEQALLYRAGQKTAPIMFGKFRRMPLNEEEDACVERMCGPDTLRIFYSNSNGLAEELLEYYVGAAETVDCTMIAEGNKDHGYYAENFPEHARVIVENIGVTGILPVAQAALLLKEANKCVSSSSSNIPIFHNSVFMKTDDNVGFTLGKTHPRDSRPYHFAAQHLRVLHGHLEEAGELDDIYVVDCPYGNGNAENPTSTATDAVKNINLAQAAFAEAAQLTNVNLADSRNGKVSLRCDTSSFGPSFVLTQENVGLRQDHKDKLFIFSKTERTLSQPKKMQVFLDSVFLDTNKTNGEIMDELRETRPEYCFSLTRMTLERLLRQHGEGSAETETNLAKIGLLYAYVAMENLHLEDEPWVVVEGEEFEDAKLSGTECQRAYRRRTYIGSAIHPMISYGRFNRHAVRHCDIIECETCQEIYVRSDLAALTGFFPPAVGFNCPRCQNRRIVHAWTTRKKIYASDKSILRQA